MLKGFPGARARCCRDASSNPAEGAATLVLACVDEEAGTYCGQSGRPKAASPVLARRTRRE